MTDGMIERAARRLAWERHNGEMRTWDQLGQQMQEQYRREVRSIISAMRKPTEAMINAAARKYQDSSIIGEWPMIYGAMIDAALAE